MRNFWELVRLVMRLSMANSRCKTCVSIVFMTAGELALPLIAVALRFLVDAILAGHEAVAAVAAVGLASAWMAQLTFWHFGYRLYLDLLDLNTISFEEELIRLVSGPAGVAHVERAAFADKLEMLRDDVKELYWSFSLVVNGFGLALQIVVTGVLLGWLAPGLLVVPAFAVPALFAGRWAQRTIDRRREHTAERRRLGRHLMELFSSPSAAKEIRGFGLQGGLRDRARRLWSQTSAELWRAESAGMAMHVGGTVIFSLAYIGSLLLLVNRAIAGRGSIGDVLLVVALTGQINQVMSRALGEVIKLQRLARSMGRYVSLRDDAKEAGGVGGVGKATVDVPAVPALLEHGIEFRDVSFGYPGAATPVLSDVSLFLPAGSVIGVVGENGSGKSTLLKLLVGLYEPGKGSILVDGRDLTRMDMVAWRSKLSAAFQDFQRFEFVARESVGVGDLPRIDHESVVASALSRAGDRDLAGALPAGLATQLGKGYAHGHELSGGEWQTVALGRSMMRESPLLLILDEPTASLDAHAEHTLFERYAEQARRIARLKGGICILVSHRFSTVRMADQIAVLDAGRLAELGSHDVLMRRKGLYASLYRLQAAGYR